MQVTHSRSPSPGGSPSENSVESRKSPQSTAKQTNCCDSIAKEKTTLVAIAVITFIASSVVMPIIYTLFTTAVVTLASWLIYQLALKVICSTDRNSESDHVSRGARSYHSISVPHAVASKPYGHSSFPYPHAPVRPYGFHAAPPYQHQAGAASETMSFLPPPPPPSGLFPPSLTARRSTVSEEAASGTGRAPGSNPLFPSGAQRATVGLDRHTSQFSTPDFVKRAQVEAESK